MTIKNANFYSVQMWFYFYVCSYDRNCKSVFNRIIFLQHNLELYNFPIIPKTLSQKELHKMLVFNRKNRKGSAGLIHNLNELLVGLKGLQQKLVSKCAAWEPIQDVGKYQTEWVSLSFFVNECPILLME